MIVSRQPQVHDEAMKILRRFMAGHAERMARIRADLVREFGEHRADEIMGKQASNG